MAFQFNPISGKLDLVAGIGSTIMGGSNNCVFYIDGSGNLACDPNFTYAAGSPNTLTIAEGKLRITATGSPLIDVISDGFGAFQMGVTANGLTLSYNDITAETDLVIAPVTGYVGIGKAATSRVTINAIPSASAYATWSDGSDKISNGTFDSDLSGWTIDGTGSGWIWDSGKATHVSGNQDNLYQNSASLGYSTFYMLSFTISGRTAGFLRLLINDVVSATITQNKTYYYPIAPITSGTVEIKFYPLTSSFNGSVDDVQLRQFTGGSSSDIDHYNRAGNLIFEERFMEPDSTVASHNMFYGRESGLYKTAETEATCINNIALGWQSHYFAASAGNVAIGDFSLKNLGIGGSNVMVGPYAGGKFNFGSGNVGIGYSATQGMQTQVVTAYNYNVGIGQQALSGVGNSYNIGIGYLTAYQTSGAGNIALGYRAGDNLSTGSYNIVIGYDINVPTNTSDGQMTIGNLLFGTGIDGTGDSLSSGNIGIGIKAPTAKLHVVNSTNSVIGFQIKGAASQSANLLSLVNSSGTDLFIVDSGGNLIVGDDGGSVDQYINVMTNGFQEAKLGLFNLTSSYGFNIGSDDNTFLFTLKRHDNSVAGVTCFDARRDTGVMNFYSDDGSSPLLTVDATNDKVSAFIIEVIDDAYDSDWNGSLAVPTKNALYDKIETLIDDTAYGAGWNGNTTAPTKNAVYDKIESLGIATLDAGTYTPSTWGPANIDSATAGQAQYMRVGNVVTVSGTITIDPTAAGATTTIVAMSLPIASTLAASSDLAGTAVNYNLSGECGSVVGDTTYHEANLVFASGTTSSYVWTYTYTYEVI